jgi:hypothetical protein
MAQIITAKNRRLEMAHILHKHIGDYQNQYRLWPEHKKIVSDLLNCRTAQLGGHIERCDSCGTLRITYHSCRNRHCPKCQHMPRERWLEKRKDEILPLKYFHVVFTLPHELNSIILNNKKVMLNGLFAAASKTLLTFGQNQLNGTPGFLAILHSWDQKLNAHFHLHCLVAGGVVALCHPMLKALSHAPAIICLTNRHCHKSFAPSSCSTWELPATAKKSDSQPRHIKSSNTPFLPNHGWSVCKIRSDNPIMCLSTWHDTPTGWLSQTVASGWSKMAW